MHCIACDCMLSDFESTRKYEESQEYIDLCNKCYDTLGIHTTERYDLEGENEYWTDPDVELDNTVDEDSV